MGEGLAAEIPRHRRLMSKKTFIKPDRTGVAVIIRRIRGGGIVTKGIVIRSAAIGFLGVISEGDVCPVVQIRGLRFGKGDICHICPGLHRF